MSKRTQEYRKVYKQHFGEIPKDVTGRSYDIHHIDGNHENNSPDNLIAIPIQEHYEKHHEIQDWKACVMIGLRLKLSREEISRLNSLAARKRVEDGTHHWVSPEHSVNMSNKVKQAVANGSYHMLGGEIQTKFQNKRVKEKTHQWCGSNSNRKMLENGTHSSQVEFTCPHCNTSGKGITNANRWHFDNCKKRI